MIRSKKNKKKYRILITGASGYIGSCLSKFLNQNYIVGLLDKKKLPIWIINKKIPFFKYDIFKMYVDKFAKGTDPYDWMVKTSKELYNKDVVKGKYLFEKGYVTEPSRLNYWSVKIVEKMVKYSKGGDMGDE